MNDVNAGDKAAQDRPTRWLLGRISTGTLERWDHIATIFGVPLVLLTLALGYFQIRDANRTAQMANFIALSTEFFNPQNTEIIEAIEAGSPIRARNQGKSSDVRLDNYLLDFETIAAAYHQGLLSGSQLCISFAHYIEITDDSNEIKDYIASVRKKRKKDEPSYFVGLLSLTEIVKLKCHK